MIKKNSDLIILSIIWVASITTLAISILKHYKIGIPNHIGYGLLVAITVLRFYKIKKFKTILGIFLILGSFNLFQFTWTMTAFFSISIFGKDYSAVGIQPFSFMLLIFFAFANFSVIANIIKKLLAADPKTERQQTIETRFYEEMKDKTDNYLIGIANNKGDYQTEYVKAAQKLLNDRRLNEKLKAEYYK